MKTLKQVDALSWRDFERLVQELFERAGYDCRYVGGLKDHGADIIATNASEVLGIQVKHRADGRRWVGERAVQAIVAALPLYKCKEGVVVTNSSFAPDVSYVARAHGIALCDRKWLGKELRKEPVSHCALCGEAVSPRVRKWCVDHPDEYAGHVYCFEHQKRFSDVLRTA